MNNTLNEILDAEQNINHLKKNILSIQNDFLQNNTPLYKVGTTYKISRIDNDILFEITQAATAKNHREIVLQTSVSLNAIFDFDFDKTSIQYKNMLLANKGLMFVYTFTECGKNGKAKKIGARTHILTESEVKEYIEKGFIST